MAQIYHRPLNPGLGALLGKGLGQGLEEMAQHKLKQMAQQQESARLAPLAQRLGMPGAENLGAQGLAQLLKEQQRQQFETGESASYNQGASGISDFFSDQTQPAPTPAPEPQVAPSQGAPPQGLPAEEIKVSETEEAGPGGAAEQIKVSATEEAGPPQRKVIPPFKDFLSQHERNGNKVSPKVRGELKKTYDKDLDRLESKHQADMGTYFATKKIKLAQRRLDDAKEKVARVEYKELRDLSQSADDKITSLKQLSRMAQTGKLQTGVVPDILQKLGFGALLNPESKEYRTTSNRLVLELAKDLKGNLSDKDINFLNESIPSLANSPGGIQKISAMLVLKERIAALPYQMAKKIVKENNGSVPFNILDLADEQSEIARNAYKNIILDIASGKTPDAFESPDGMTMVEYKNNSYQY